MKKTNKLILMFLLISLLLLGIGYAAIQNITLTILGFAEVGAKAENFIVKFVDPVMVDNNGYNEVTVDAQKTGDTTATINLSGLSKVNEKISVKYKIANESKDLSADLAVATTNDTPEYLTISSQLEKTSLVAGDETTVEVIITVTKTPITENIKAKIGVELIAMPVQPGEEGTSEGIKDFDQTPNSNVLNKFGYYYDRFYCNEEAGVGYVSHSDYSLEVFQLFTTDEYQNLEKNEWVCVEYLEAGNANPEELIMQGARFEDDGNKMIDVNGIELILSDIIPHGIYTNNIYESFNDNGELVVTMIFENGTINSTTYDENGSILKCVEILNYFRTKANGYMITILNQDLASINITGDGVFDDKGNKAAKLEEIHNYKFEIVEEATCTSDGSRIGICSDCGDTYTIGIMFYNHRYDRDYNSVCDNCGIKFEEYNKSSIDGELLFYTFGSSYINFTEICIPPYSYEELFGIWCKVERIQSDTFDECYNLRKIVIPATVTEIYDGAFEDCHSLDTINYTGTEEQWNEIIIGDRNEPLMNATINYNYVIPTE